MNTILSNKLNEIEGKISSSGFLQGKGLAHEIPFYIFDYPPEEEVPIREHIEFLVKRLKDHYKIKVLSINLFDFLVSYLKQKNIYEKCFDLEQNKGKGELQKALNAPLKAENLVRELNAKYNPSEYELLIISGVGNVYPFIRSHTLLNNLQSVMGSTPLVLFYPGRYDGKHLKLFGKVESNPYYRAFRLIP